MGRVFLILSGGPGKYNAKDPERHDQAWSSFVDHPLVLQKQGKFPKASDEKVHWVIYKPAYEERWTDDVSRGDDAPDAVKKKGFSSYTALLEGQAAAYGWKLKWIDRASGLWDYVRGLGDPVSRMWYYGHARYDLWLSLRHNSSNVAINPVDSAIVTRSSIPSALAGNFEPGGSAYDRNKSSKLYGCNTDRFAKDLAVAAKVFAEGARGKVRFQEVHSSGQVGLATDCTWVGYKPDGTEFAP